jgi:prepilin-type N-terminal cleavage/methylation domain-containing protein
MSRRVSQHSIPRCRGMTLLEVLLTLVLLAVIAVTVLTWTRTQAAGSRVAVERAQVTRSMLSVVRLLNDDLAGAIMDEKESYFRLVDAHTFELLSLHSVPGDPPGIHKVLWNLDNSENAIERKVTDVFDLEHPQTRIVSRRIRGARLNELEKPRRLVVEFPEQGQGGSSLIIPLWSSW